MKFLRNILGDYRIQIFIHLLLLVFFTVSLITYDLEDPSWNSYNSGDAENLMGIPGSIISDIMMQLFGIASLMYIILFMLWIKTLWQNKELKFLWAKILLSIFAASLFASSFASLNLNILYFNTTGVTGIMIKPLLDFVIGPIAPLISFIFGIFLLVIASGHDLREFLQNTVALAKKIHLPTMRSSPKTVAHTPKIMPKTLQPQEPSFATSRNDFASISTHEAIKPAATPQVRPVKPSNGNFNLPDIDLLDVYTNKKVKMETEQELQAKSEDLLRVLGDFGVRGNMTDIHQGPVVTLYEFEPSAGTKSSRVIGLSDDVARSLSALSTRIAVMPGRNALGIEIPNENRQFFSLRELIETEEYNDPKLALPIILGKDLGGKAAVVDLSKMPHLLVAGTTGSGKSVAINAMIISLLYRHTAETCKFIMIDPKMLELSVYQDIPHLLTPVVTEPGKAVVALKWAVKEMENRYRLMSNLGVRNISGYNDRIEEAIKTGQVLERTVQTGFDPETGKPIYETMPIEMQSLPFIVVIVDEMADLMLVAGKDIETSIQRLAQMARAAGIHLIMATQRPSVDVITGVIKANFPSRVSFKVTSKIDSRTILGEQGAEQLLGMGDMLYVSSVSTVSRCHGPFVDDKEVERIAKFLKSQGHPQYITSVTESEEDEAFEDGFGEEGVDDDSLYRQALQIVKRDRKVSTSYIQRCLRIGYNRAAIIIERMEAEGIVSPPGHTGRREILLGE
jgi:S-DNA-T family DNA segregation ATPase FtsK/SpoIIIE